MKNFKDATLTILIKSSGTTGPVDCSQVKDFLLTCLDYNYSLVQIQAISDLVFFTGTFEDQNFLVNI